jgi:hypothetical protein
VVSTTTAQGECSDITELKSEQQATHNIQHTTAAGLVVTLTGTVTSNSSQTPATGSRTQSSTVDTTRTRVDASGSTIDSVHLTGTLESTFDKSAETPTQTSSGSMTVTQADGTTSSATLTNVVRVPRETCDWPISGTIERTADGIAHVLVFGPDCGQATLDGTATTLPAHQRGPGGPHGRRGPGGRPGGGR